MREWKKQHENTENVITEGVQKVLDAYSAKWDGVVKRAKKWNFTFAFILTLILVVMTVIAFSFIQNLRQMREDAVENQKVIKEVRDYLADKKKEDAKEAKEWRENMEKWSKR